jgi:hypothetical protein
MKQVMVRYKVKTRSGDQERETRPRRLRRTASHRPAGFRYATFQLDDGVTFVHLASVESEAKQSPLAALESFQRFQTGIADRCDEPPVVTETREIGSFRAFGR